MRKVVIILGVFLIAAVISSGVLIDVVLPKFADKEQTSDKKWGESDPPARYADYCKEKGIRWTKGWQTNYMNGDLREVWKVNENGDSVLTMLHYHKVWTNDSELSDMEKSKIERGREMSKEQWSRIKDKVESGELKPKKDVMKYSGE